jgi:hypothetical protein
MADTCATCGTKLGFARRLTGAKECADCAAKSKADRQAAEAEYRTLLGNAADPATDLATLPMALPALAQRASLAPQAARDLSWTGLLAAFDRALADEVITRDEEARLQSVGVALGFDVNDFGRALEHTARRCSSRRSTTVGYQSSTRRESC